MAPLSLEGQTLGKYRILEPLGRGGMAQVSQSLPSPARSLCGGQSAPFRPGGRGGVPGPFPPGGRGGRSLGHPNIVQIFDFDKQDDLYYMVMELLEGDTLKAYP